MDPSTIKNLSRAEHVLFSLALFAAVLLAPAAQYILAFSLLIWSVVTKGWPLADFSVELKNKQAVLHPFWMSMALASVLSITVGVAAYFGNPWVVNSGQYFKEVFRLPGKTYLLPLVLIVVFKIARVRNYRIERDLFWLSALMVLTIAYMVLQRYAGVDWIHGFDARLPANRFNYGVYRANGWVSHPLTLGFNLMLITIVAYCSMRSLKGKPFHRFAALFFVSGLAGLVLSQSRWPLAVTALVIFIRESSKIWRHRLMAVVLMILSIGVVSLENGLRGRVVELFESGQTLEQKVERVLFWKVHAMMFRDNPVLGVGYPVREEASLDYYNRAGYTNNERKYNAHNIYLQLLADSGVFGLAALFVLLSGLWWSARRLNTDHGCTVQLLTVSALLGGLMQNNFRDTEFLFGYWMLIAWLLCNRPAIATSQGTQRDDGTKKIENYHS